MYIETHGHLNDEAFNHDLPETLERARQAGVEAFILPADSEASWARVLEIAAREPDCYAALGIHPSDAAGWDEGQMERLAALLEQADSLRVVAVGEVGLDYHYDNDDQTKAAQKRCLRQQAELAHRFRLPLILHDRESHEDIVELLEDCREAGLLAEEPGVFHCYSGSEDFYTQRILPLGFLAGFDGPLTFKNARKPREAAATVPLDKLLIETDSPYLAPVPYRGKRNEPAYLPYIAQALADCKAVSLELIARHTTDNARRLFDLN